MEDIQIFFKQTELYLRQKVEQIQSKILGKLENFSNQIFSELKQLDEYFQTFKNRCSELQGGFERLKIQIKLKIEDLQQVQEFADNLSIKRSFIDEVTQQTKQQKLRSGEKIFQQQVQDFNQFHLNVYNEEPKHQYKQGRKTNKDWINEEFEQSKANEVAIQSKKDQLNSRYTCSFCQKLIMGIRRYRRHLVDYHDQPQWYICPSCQSIQTSQTKLAKHLFEIHARRFNRYRYYVCPYTNEEFSTETFLQIHLTNTVQYHRYQPDDFNDLE